MDVDTGLSHEEDRDQQQGYLCLVEISLVQLLITVLKIEDMFGEHQWMMIEESTS